MFCLAAVLFSGCVKPVFHYVPNPPIYPNVVSPEEALYHVSALVSRLDSLADYHENTPGQLRQDLEVNLKDGHQVFTANLAGRGSSSWPRLSPKILTEALAAELQASSLVSSAKALGKEDSLDAKMAAVRMGAKIVIDGRLRQATLSYSRVFPGAVLLKMDIKALARYSDEAGSLANDYCAEIWSGSFTQIVKIKPLPAGVGTRPSEAIEACVQGLYHQAMESLGKKLEKMAAANPGTGSDPCYGFKKE